MEQSKAVVYGSRKASPDALKPHNRFLCFADRASQYSLSN